MILSSSIVIHDKENGWLMTIDGKDQYVFNTKARMLKFLEKKLIEKKGEQDGS
jgi:hypothetical protein